ncbi:MAG: ABC transporter ATP-binding protein [Verrucomicrobia bacterium]|nr:ABC transporter ATP-binding protein [Verrucomicrobiota bacterium]
MPDSSIPAIEVLNLHRNFGNLKAVDGVSCKINPGTVVGFVGANGAGKTTTMRILATLDYPTRGTVKIGGIDVVQYPAKVRSKIGWMPDSFGTYSHMTVIEYLDFFARALGFSGQDRIDRVTDIMDFTDLDSLSNRLINTLSKGMGQRLCLGRALIHDPDVLILDEPAAGLDPKARVELKHLIRILAEDGKTVLISSHILSELAEMCDSLLFINKGKIIHEGSAESLKRDGSGTTIIRVEIHGNKEKIAEWAQMSPIVKLKETLKNGVRLEVESVEPEVIASVLGRMIKDGLSVVEFHREERKLEDAFIDILGEIEAQEAKAAKPPKLN